MAKELVFATYIDMNTKQVAALNGNSAVMVLQLEDADKFIKDFQTKSFKKLAVLGRVEAGSKWQSEFMEAIQEYQLPNNKSHWYRLKPLQESIEKLNQSKGYTPKVYNPKKKRLIKS